MLDHGTLTAEDLDIQTFGSALPNLGPNIRDPRVLSALVDHYSAQNAVAEGHSRPFTRWDTASVPFPDPMEIELQKQLHDEFMRQMDSVQAEPGSLNEYEGTFVDYDNLPNLIDDDSDDDDSDAEEEEEEDLNDRIGAEDASHDEQDVIMRTDAPGNQDRPNDAVTPLLAVEDEHDPFKPINTNGITAVDLSYHPPHLQIIYAAVTWLHLQFHLPRTACQALLAILACMLFFISSSIPLPLVTLTSANRALSLDIPIQVLALCTICKTPFPNSTMTQDTCPTCATPLFLPDTTWRGKRRKKMRIPVLRYPYLSITEQLTSIVAIPGMEDLMDQWRTVSRTPGVYQDIFDGRVAQQLPAHNNTKFFSNLPTEARGPQGELRLGLTLGADW